MSKSYMNSNGLENGLIPAGRICPFLSQCKLMVVDRCPSEKHQPPGAYSCAAARLWSITIKAREEGHPNELLEGVRDKVE
jgi:hypothetical protein